MAEAQLDFDFGAPISVIKDPSEFLDLPDEVAKRRAVREDERVAAYPGLLEEVKGQAKAAVEAEALKADGVVFEFDSEFYWVPKLEDWDLEIFEAQEDGQLIKLVRSLLGVQQYEKFKTEANPENPDVRQKKKRTPAQLGDLLEAATKALGVKPGE